MKKILCLRLLILITLIGYGDSLSALSYDFENKLLFNKTLVYKLKYNWEFVWINAGTATLAVNECQDKGKKVIKTELRSYTNKKIDFFFKMRDTLVSITNMNIQPIYFKKTAEEGNRYSIDQVSYIYSGNECIISQSRERKGCEPYSRIDTVDYEVYDMLSIMLKTRLIPNRKFNPNEVIKYRMATGRTIESQSLIYRNKEFCKCENGKIYRCLVFSLVDSISPGNDKEIIRFYVTDDDRHIPVRLDMNLKFGTAKAFLQEIIGVSPTSRTKVSLR